MSTLKVNEIDSKTGTTITVAAGKTLAGTDIIDTTQIAADAITATEIEAAAVGATELAATLDLSSKSITLAAGEVSAGELATTLDLSSKTVTVPAATVTTHVTAFDDAALRNDIATLALHSAITDNKAAYNLANAFIDQFEDDTGIDVETTTDRDIVNEFMIAGVAGTGNDANTILLVSSDTTDGSTTFVDTSSASPTHVVDSVIGDVEHKTDQKKFGTSSMYFDGGASQEGVRWAAHSDFKFNDDSLMTDFTIDAWVRPEAGQNQHSGVWGTTDQSSWTQYAWFCGYSDHASRLGLHMGRGPSYTTNLLSSGSAITHDTWYHMAWTADSGTFRIYLDGVQVASAVHTNALLGQDTWKATLGAHEPNGSAPFKGWIDDFRISNVCRYPNGTTFSVPTAAYGNTVLGAAGNFTSTTQTAAATVSKMSIVLIYKNTSGTATLDADLVAQVSSNGGTNYVSAPLTAAGTFSTGMLIAKSNDITISNTGTAPKYKISFANQSSGTKETRLYGVALLY